MSGIMPDWMPFIGTKDKVNYWFGDNTAEEIESGEWSGLLPGDQSGATQYVPGVGADTPEGHGYLHNDIPFIGTQEKAMNTAKNIIDPFGVGDYMMGGSNPQQSIRNFDMNDKESVKQLQERLGVTADGMFGPETEKAYRLAVDAERKANDQESLKYDYNPQEQSKKFSPFGGLLRNAYSNLDKGIFKGKLPGGFKESDVTTAEEYYNR